MSNYKNIRLEEHVYNELVRRMKPRESMSQVIERMINTGDVVYSYLKSALAAVEGGKE